MKYPPPCRDLRPSCVGQKDERVRSEFPQYQTFPCYVPVMVLGSACLSTPWESCQRRQGKGALTVPCQPNDGGDAGAVLTGRHLRSWLPVFVYVVPVTYCAAVFMAGYSLLVEGASIVHPFSVHPPGVLGWLQPQYLPRVLYLGVSSGRHAPNNERA